MEPSDDIWKVKPLIPAEVIVTMRPPSGGDKNLFTSRSTKEAWLNWRKKVVREFIKQGF